MICDSEKILTIGNGSAYDDFYFINHSQPDHTDRLMQMLKEEKKYLPNEDKEYFNNLQNDSSLIKWRHRVAEWAFNVTDTFQLSRETACIALSYLDRFLSSSSICSGKFRIASLTTLFIASKLVENNPIQIMDIHHLSGFSYSRDEIIHMEKTILDQIGWELYPPTASAFMNMFCHYFELSPSTTKSLIENSQFMLELAACDCFFVNKYPSKAAIAAILYTIDLGILQIDNDDRETWKRKLYNVINIEFDDNIEILKERLSRIHRSLIDRNEQEKSTKLNQDFKNQQSYHLEQTSQINKDGDTTSPKTTMAYLGIR